METYIKYDTAFLAKKKGLEFQLDDGDNCMCYHLGNKEWHFAYHVHLQFPKKDDYVFAPTQAFLANWLRDTHNIQVYAYSSTKNGSGKYRDYVVYVNGFALNDARDEEFQTYEEALEVGLEYALNQI
jgi:hypothetical protein